MRAIPITSSPINSKASLVKEISFMQIHHNTMLQGEAVLTVPLGILFGDGNQVKNRFSSKEIRPTNPKTENGKGHDPGGFG